MPRDDSMLYTGASSASFSKIPKVRTIRKEENKEKRTALSPASDIILTEIQKEIDKIIHGIYPNEDTMSDEQFRAERRGRRLAVEALMNVKTRLANVLKER